MCWLCTTAVPLPEESLKGRTNWVRATSPTATYLLFVGTLADSLTKGWIAMSQALSPRLCTMTSRGGALHHCECCRSCWSPAFGLKRKSLRAYTEPFLAMKNWNLPRRSVLLQQRWVAQQSTPVSCCPRRTSQYKSQSQSTTSVTRWTEGYSLLWVNPERTRHSASAESQVGLPGRTCGNSRGWDVVQRVHILERSKEWKET